MGLNNAFPLCFLTETLPQIEGLPQVQLPDGQEVTEAEETTQATVETVEETVEETVGETVGETAQPSPGTWAVSPQMIWGGLALVFILLAVVIVRCLQKEKPRDTGTNQPENPKEAEAPTIAAEPAPARIAVACHQHIGAREDQQDSYAVTNPAAYDQQGLLAVVADGMGGLSNGGAVSAALVSSFLDSFRSSREEPVDLLLEAAARANGRINQMLRGAEKSGSTLVAALIKNGYLSFLSVGDSRIYLYRGGALIQLNREHAYREELAVKAVNQEAPLARVRGDRQTHALTSFFGIGKIPHIDRNSEGIRLIRGDRILLASDGVFGTLSAQQLEQALALEIREAAEQIGREIRQANLPYQDNNTAVIVEYLG